MRLHYLQHVPFEGIGCIASWAERRSAEVSATRLFAGEALPFPEDVDLLVVMGGPMGIYDDAEHSWLKAEKRFLAEALSSGVCVIGICLGAQLLADVLGAKVVRNRHKEIGWLPIELVNGADATPFGGLLGKSEVMFQWHADTFEIPAGATHLARSQACENQAFCVGDQVLALQFHPEITPDSTAELIRHCGNAIDDGPYVQPAAELLADPTRFVRPNQVIMDYLDLLTAE